MHQPCLASIASAARRRISEFELRHAPRSQVIEFVFDLTAVAWAFEFVLCLSDDLLFTIRDFEVACGQELDDRLSHGMRSLQVPPKIHNPAECAGVTPRIPINLRGMVVVFKPPSWEVDGKGSRLITNPEINDGRLGLSSFIQMNFAAKVFQLPHLPEFDHGFLHRLDIPSSGLILTGVTMEGYYSLRLQLNTYRLGREYYVACHGRIHSNFQKVYLGIGSTVVNVRKSIGDDCGKPAETHIKVSPHVMGHRFWQGPWTLVAIRIRTGRHHQIRTHMLHSGHPTVTDAKYTVWRLLEKT